MRYSFYKSQESHAWSSLNILENTQNQTRTSTNRFVTNGFVGHGNLLFFRLAHVAYAVTQRLLQNPVLKNGQNTKVSSAFYQFDITSLLYGLSIHRFLLIFVSSALFLVILKQLVVWLYLYFFVIMLIEYTLTFVAFLHFLSSVLHLSLVMLVKPFLLLGQLLTVCVSTNVYSLNFLMILGLLLYLIYNFSTRAIRLILAVLLCWCSLAAVWLNVAGYRKVPSLNTWNTHYNLKQISSLQEFKAPLTPLSTATSYTNVVMIKNIFDVFCLSADLRTFTVVGASLTNMRSCRTKTLFDNKLTCVATVYRSNMAQLHDVSLCNVSVHQLLSRQQFLKSVEYSFNKLLESTHVTLPCLRANAPQLAIGFFNFTTPAVNALTTSSFIFVNKRNNSKHSRKLTSALAYQTSLGITFSVLPYSVKLARYGLAQLPIEAVSSSLVSLQTNRRSDVLMRAWRC